VLTNAQAEKSSALLTPLPESATASTRVSGLVC
jgi:hypothetical protein